MAKAEVTPQYRGPGKPTWRIQLAGKLAFSVKIPQRHTNMPTLFNVSEEEGLQALKD